MENFKFLSISELKDKRFFIPNYQRGYKWEKEQVEDLLNDINEFMNADKDKVGMSYCIQPLVVGNRQEDSEILEKIKEANSIPAVEALLTEREMEVIDGQQRLTTIFLILSALNVNKKDQYHYTIQYATREKSWDFLQKITEEFNGSYVREQCIKNEDFYHIYQAYDTITTWLRKTKESDPTFREEQFLITLMANVKFIWYHSIAPNPVQVFRRLNDGKISLTDSELIKALVLHCEDSTDKNTFERATEWDEFEIRLQDDEFWLFIQNDIKYKKPNRIEWVLDLICNHDLLELTELNSDFRNELGNDNHVTFRYFDLYVRLNKERGYEVNATYIWNKAKSIMAAITEWYSDCRFFHYIGYLIHQNTKICDIYEKWREPGITKSLFLQYLQKEISRKLAGCNDFSKVYTDTDKGECRPLLLLHNIEEVLWQNRSLQKERRFGMGAFYRFPFHLYKKEEKKGGRNGWEIEHIASNSGDSDDERDIAFFLESSKNAIHDDKLKQRIESFDISAEDSQDTYMGLREAIRKYFGEVEWSDNDKNKVWNFTLLDSGTNQEYKNSVFPFKRLYIINKERGHKTICRYDEKTKKAHIELSAPAVSFIPPITKKIFTKAFSQSPITLNSWTFDDAKNYILDLENKTENYLPGVYRWLRVNIPDDALYVKIISEIDLNTLKSMRMIMIGINRVYNLLNKLLK